MSKCFIFVVRLFLCDAAFSVFSLPPLPTLKLQPLSVLRPPLFGGSHEFNIFEQSSSPLPRRNPSIINPHYHTHHAERVTFDSRKRRERCETEIQSCSSLPGKEWHCDNSLVKEVRDCLSSCKKFRIPFQTFFFCNNYTKKFLIVFLAYLLLKNLD